MKYLSMSGVLEVTRLVLAWAFDVLGVHRVELQALANNSRAVNCYLACGFRQEGVRREAEQPADLSPSPGIVQGDVQASGNTLSSALLISRNCSGAPHLARLAP
jgi:RimJ/RimL family protein N-acetyltransferase